MGADLGVPLSDLRLLCVSVAGGESRKTLTQFSKRENAQGYDGRRAWMLIPREIRLGEYKLTK